MRRGLFVLAGDSICSRESYGCHCFHKKGESDSRLSRCTGAYDHNNSWGPDQQTIDAAKARVSGNPTFKVYQGTLNRMLSFDFIDPIRRRQGVASRRPISRDDISITLTTRLS